MIVSRRVESKPKTWCAPAAHLASAMHPERKKQSQSQRVKYGTDSRSPDSCAGCQGHGGVVHLDRVQTNPTKRRGWRDQLGEADLRKQRSHVPIRWNPSTEQRSEADLYILTDNVDDLYRRLKDRVQVVVELYDAFYGMREFIIRDFNGFWITFGQPI